MYVQAQIYDYNSTKLRGQNFFPKLSRFCLFYLLPLWVGGVHNLEFRTTHTLFLERNYLNIFCSKNYYKISNYPPPPPTQKKKSKLIHINYMYIRIVDFP